MSLRSNLEVEPYKEFYGRKTEKMQELVAEGRFPMSSAELMQIRIDVRNSDSEVKSYYMDNYFDTGDAIVYHPDGRFKIVLDSQHLRDMTPETPRKWGALVLGEDVYNALEGEEFKKGKLVKVNKNLSREDVKSHPVLRVLARDPALLDAYADLIFVEGKERFGYDTAMGVFIGYANGDKPEMMAWYVSRLGSRSSVDGWNNLGYDAGCFTPGRFVGVVPDARMAKI